METPEQVLEASLVAYNAHDLAAYIATFAPQATFGQLGGRTLLDGRDRMEAFFKDFFADQPSVRCEIAQRAIIGPFVVEHQVVSNPEASAQGRPPLETIVISEVRDGHIAKVWYAPVAGGPPGQ